MAQGNQPQETLFQPGCASDAGGVYCGGDLQSGRIEKCYNPAVCVEEGLGYVDRERLARHYCACQALAIVARCGERPSREADVPVRDIEQQDCVCSPRRSGHSDRYEVDRRPDLFRSRQPAPPFVEGSLGAGLPRDGITRAIVGMPGLALKREKDGHPPVGAGEPKQQTTVMPHTIVAGMIAGARIPLVHMDVVDAAIGLELEDLVRLILGTPGLPKGKNDRTRVVFRPFDLRVDQIVEVVPVARHVRR